MAKQLSDAEIERNRCLALVNHALDAVLAAPPTPHTIEGDWCAMLGAIMRTIRHGGDVIDLEQACPVVFGGARRG